MAGPAGAPKTSGGGLFGNLAKALNPFQDNAEEKAGIDIFGMFNSFINAGQILINPAALLLAHCRILKNVPILDSLPFVGDLEPLTTAEYIALIFVDFVCFISILFMTAFIVLMAKCIGGAEIDVGISCNDVWGSWFEALFATIRAVVPGI